ncbi:hypothetical protein [Epilithonimonas hungarica]|uniref:Uncharacterized protein n=1 Tax=Epilithonimonas hungarica TaxID=454006 RepID=A0A1G7PK20_9FLAO|nr:hypothetical protein [Epilithonimonas hungarica]SDF86583.1 hypothetical protein SAMN05421825_2321 [Epilithonimonas hungarica]
MDFKIKDIIRYKAPGKICEIVGTKEHPKQDVFNENRPKKEFDFVIREIKTNQLFDVYQHQIEKYEG